MTTTTAEARKLADDFDQRSNIDKLELLHSLVVEGYAQYTVYDIDGQTEMEIHGISAAGTLPLDFIQNYCVMARRQTEFRPSVKFCDLKEGDQVKIDDGFTCMRRGTKTVMKNQLGLYLCCDDGTHFLDGQVDLTGNLIGISQCQE